MKKFLKADAGSPSAGVRSKEPVFTQIVCRRGASGKSKSWKPPLALVV